MDRDTEIEIEEYRKKLAENPASLIFLPLAEIYRKNSMFEEATIVRRTPHASQMSDISVKFAKR